MKPAIEVTGLGKRYDLGEREQYRALRDVLSRTPRRLVGKLGPGGDEATGPRPQAWALRDVNFDVQPGEVLGIVGRNGAGKSTLLKVLSQITSPTEGRVVTRGRVGSLLEVGSGFHPELTGAENIRLNGAILGMKKAEITSRFDDIVEFAGIGRFLHTPVKRYSTGMYMRLAFAVAAHLEPEILMIDEVLAVGDAEFQRKCLGRMSELAGGHGRTVLFVSHNLDAINQLCRRSIWLEGGHVRADGTSVEVVNKYLEQHMEMSTAGTWVELDDTVRKGTGEVRFDRLQFLGAGPSGTPYSGGPITVEVVLTARTPVAIGSFAANIATLGGTILVNADPVFGMDVGLELEPGEHRFKITIEAVHLTPGSYAIGLWMARGRGDKDWSIYDSVEQATHLDLIASPTVELPAGQAIVPCKIEFERC